MTRVAPGRTRGTTSPGLIVGPRSSSLTTTRSARVTSAPPVGARRSTSRPATRTRSRPCQPSATKRSGARIVSHASMSSLATGARTMAAMSARSAAHGPDIALGGMASLADRQRWRRPAAISMFWKTGPRASLTGSMSAPAARSRWSSDADAATPSTPTRMRVAMPSRASVRPAYATAPPRRQPRGSSAVRSREAAPMTSAVSCRAQSLLPGDPFVLLRIARRR